MLYILVYLGIGLAMFLASVGWEYWIYKRHGRLDTKFPITHSGTVYILAAISLLWIFFLALIFYSWLVSLWSIVKDCLR